jgi:putative copper export protein
MPAIDAWEAALVLVKALTYGATLAGAGGVLFASYSHDLLSPVDLDILRRWLRTLAVAAAAASGLSILVKAASLSGDIGGMFDFSLTRMVWNAGEARATVLRLIGLALMSAGSLDVPRLRTAQLAGVILAATSFAWVGHTHAVAGVPLPEFALVVHLLGVAFWVGALVPLLIVARGTDTQRVAAVASRFGAAAVFVVGLLAAAGACLLCALLASVAELWTTPYGRSAILKLALVAILLSLAALNRYWLTPRLRANRANAILALRYSIRMELGVAAAILIATAAMTTLSGPAALP